MADNDKKRAAESPSGKPAAKKAASDLQIQIQSQLQQQLQAQLSAAASKGQQANITPEQIQAQAQAMVQAAAQAQAVVAAAKSRGDGLVPMNAQQIQALSQIQAQAIVQARKQHQNASQTQIQTQTQLQAQALVHAHTQAQIQAGIYKGDPNKDTVKDEDDEDKKLPADIINPVSLPAAAATASAAAAVASQPVMTNLTQAQLDEEAELQQRQTEERKGKSGADLDELEMVHQQQLAELHANFQQQNAGLALGEDLPQPSSNSPQFLAQLNGALDEFWQQTLHDVRTLDNQTEQDFKNHNDLPLARIKRIMKADADVRMISAEAPVLFAKACELFILDLSIRSWNYSQLHKRRTLQKEDVREAIQKTDIFDFLVDIIQ